MFIKKIVIIFVVILAVGLFVALDIGWYNPAWNPFHQTSSAKVIEGAVANLAEAKTLKIDWQMGMTFSPEIARNNKIGNVLIVFSHTFDKNDAQNVKGDTLLNFSLKFEETDIVFQAAIRNIGQNIYLKLVEFPSFLSLGSSVGDIKNKWLQIDAQTASQILGYSQQELPAQKEKDQEFLSKLSQLFLDKEILKIERTLDAERIDGIWARHYVVALDKKGLKEFIPQFMSLVQEYVPEEQKESFNQELNKSLPEFNQKFDQIWQGIGGIKFDAWVVQDGGYLKKVKMDKQIEQNRFSLEINFSGFNQKIDIAEPTDAKPIEDIISLSTLNPSSFFTTSSISTSTEVSGE